jgi:hypothetical protein
LATSACRRSLAVLFIHWDALDDTVTKPVAPATSDVIVNTALMSTSAPGSTGARQIVLVMPSSTNYTDKARKGT